MDFSRLIRWVLSLKIVRAYLRYANHRGPALADGITYRALFSVFAAVLLGFSAAAVWLAGNTEAWKALVDAVDRVIPGLVGDDGLIKTSALSSLSIGFSIAGALSLVGLVGAAIGAIGSLRIAIRVICDQLTDDLAFYWVLLRNLGLAIAAGGALGLSAAVTVLGTAGLGIVADWLGVPGSSPLIDWGSRLVAIVATFVLDAVAIAVLFRALSRVHASARSLWAGALLGAVALTILQQLSGLFVGGASSNPLLASFASLIALLLWFNLSAQAILLAVAYIYTGVEEEHDRVRARYGAQTFPAYRVRQAEDIVRVAEEELKAARAANGASPRASE